METDSEESVHIKDVLLTFDDEGVPTKSSEDQIEVEESIIPLLETYWTNTSSISKVLLEREKHERFILKGLNGLSKGYVALDASHPWILYWMLHSLDLLGKELSIELKMKAVKKLRNCLNEDGGFGGGFRQMSHLATTYAAVNAIAILDIPEAYALIDRQKIHSFFLSLKQPDGSFTMHLNGEIDVRGSYCALSVAKLLDMLTPELYSLVANFICSCQTYEGGIAGLPGSEAHGGYTFCALAAMDILESVHELRVSDLTCWALQRQMKLEGGFQGRVNKLVDGCYSFWLGGIFPILKKYDDSVDYDRQGLQSYILYCCQAEKGGLRDKPGKSPDFYHTCYVLSGLSSSQYRYQYIDGWFKVDTIHTCLGDMSNLIKPIDPVHNISMVHRNSIHQYFKSNTFKS